MTLLGVVSTGRRPGRGGSSYRYFNFEEMKEQDKELTQAGRVSGDEMWGRITCFLERVIPVAEACGVKMACHPHDPGMPPSGYGYRGIDRAPGTVDGMKKFIEIVDSSYHGLNFCHGTFSEMCRRPRQEDLRRHPLFW